MARIAGVDLPRDKRVEIGLTYILWNWPYSFQKNIGRNRSIPGYPC